MKFLLQFAGFRRIWKINNRHFDGLLSRKDFSGIIESLEAGLFYVEMCLWKVCPLYPLLFGLKADLMNPLIL